MQVQLATPPPSFPSDDGDWYQDRVSHVDGSEDEARRDVEAGLGMDVDVATRKRGRARTPRGRSRSPAPRVRASSRGRSRPLTPSEPCHPSPSEWKNILGPAQLASLIRHTQTRAGEVRQQMD